MIEGLQQASPRGHQLGSDLLTENPHVGKLLKGELAGLRRIRVGTYRVIYEIIEEQILILILRVAHRKQVHR